MGEMVRAGQGCADAEFWGGIGEGEQINLDRWLQVYGRSRFYFPAKFALL
jgi:hypothetical protein